MGALLGHRNEVLKLRFALDPGEWVELSGIVEQRLLDKQHEGVEEHKF
jgi:hypothetical protein